MLLVGCISRLYIIWISDAVVWVYFSQGSGLDSGSKYTIINRAMMFTAAQKECGSLGGHLPFVNSLREQIFLEDFITQELMNPGELDIQAYLIIPCMTRTNQYRLYKYM